MSIGKALGRVGIVLSVAVAVGLIGCTDGDNPGGGGGYNYTGGTVTINGLTWTAENININTADSWCYEDNASNCAKYGRLYTWEAAKSVCAGMGGGWRLPTREDWNKLVDYAGGEAVAGKKLKSKTGWNENNGTDDYGFSALPGGYRRSHGYFNDADNIGYWWSATEYGSDSAYIRYMYYSVDFLYEGTDDKSYGFSVRCAQD